MNFLVVKIISCLTNVFPVSKKIWVFNSYPDFTDNPYAFFHKALPQRPDVHFVWLFSDKKLLKEMRKNNKASNVSFLSKKSLLGLWYFLRCGFLFVSHGIFDRYRADDSSKIVINLWHGMPLKRICYMEAQTEWVTYSDYVIATSPLFKSIMSQSFKTDDSHTLLVGQPRNDLLFEDTDFFEKKKIDRNRFSKIGAWLPTYRCSIIQQRTDGAFHNGQLLFLNTEDLKKLDEFLVEKNILLIVKLHPMDCLQNYVFPEFSNLMILKQKDFDSQLYPFLGNCDFLLTDYSSVWVDYEILNRPIGLVCDDFDDYAQNRGFTIPNFWEKMSFPILKNLDELEEFVANLPQRKGAEDSVFNTYRDDHSSDRLLALLDGMKK